MNSTSDADKGPLIPAAQRKLSRSDIAIVVVLIVAIAMLSGARSVHYLLFHTMAEVLAIVVSLSIFMLTWVSYRFLANGYLIVLGGAYAAIGFVDVLHTLTFRGMNLFPGVTPNYPTQFWLIARYMEAIALLWAPLAIRRKPDFFSVSTGFAALAAVCLVVVLYQWFPATFIDGIGLTPFKIYSEYIIVVMLITGTVLLVRAKQHFEARIFFLLVASIGLAIATEICFTLYVSFFDFTNELGHYFRFLSVALAFIAVVLSGVRHPLELIFREMNAHKHELDELNAQLIDREGRLSAIFQTSPMGIIVSRLADGRILDANEAVLRMYEYGPDEVIGRTVAELGSYVYPEQRDELVRVLREHGRVDHFAIDFRKRSGEVGVLEVAARTITLQGEQCLLAILVDVTESRRAEAALRESEQNLQLLIKHAPVALAMFDREMRYLSVSRRWMREYGLGDRDLRGLKHYDVFPDLPAHWKEIHRRALTGEELGSDAERFDRADGTVQWIRWEVLPWRGAQGEIGGIVIFSEDLSDIKRGEENRMQLEAQLRESQKMEALGTLAGGVAHDFNNALATIIGNVELARQDVGPDHAALVSLDEIGKASRRAKDLVQQILAFGRRQKLDRRVTSLSLVVVETARLVRATLPAAISLKLDCDGGTPAVLADATQIKQVLLNLCANAQHAIQGRGRPGIIDIRLGCHIAVDSSGKQAPGRYACLSVRDNGVGMDEDALARIFEPFFTTKPKGEGTGLGLSVVHGIVKAHDASIEVDSVPGEGSEFRIYFPASESQVVDAVERAAEVAPIDGGGKRVLYVDDEEAIVFLMTRLLERQGYRVSGYTDPREALAAARADASRYDLAVTDFNMPGMTGLEVARALREICPDLPVVLASGYINEELRQAAPAAGVNELIYKPNTVDDLCDAVARFAKVQSRIVPENRG